MSGRQWNYKAGRPLGLQMNERVSKALKGQLPKDAFGQRIYDTLRFKAGNATSTSPIRLFTVPVGGSTSVANAASETYNKTLQDTNLEQAGLLQQGETFIVNSMQVMVTVLAQTDTTYPTSGPGTELATDPTAAAGVSGLNTANAVLDQTYFRFYIGSKDYERGPGYLFPSAYGISGFAGFGISTDFEGVANNGFGHPYIFPVQREIPSLTTFFVECQFLQALTIRRNFVLRVILDGVIFRMVQ